MENYQSDYRTLLKEELLKRKDNNPAYSVRAYARDLGVSPAFMSLLLNGKRSLTESKADEVCAKMDWDSGEKKLFGILVRLEQASSDSTRKKLEQELNTLAAANDQYSLLSIDVFQAICRWYHTAIIELTRLNEFKADSRWMGRKLGISEIEVELAVDRLLRLGLLKRTAEGNLVRANEKLSVEEIPSASIRSYHKTMLTKASDALDHQSMNERNFSAVTIAIDPSKIDAAKERIREFRRDLVEFLNTGKRKAVYQLSVQFFRLDRE